MTGVSLGAGPGPAGGARSADAGSKGAGRSRRRVLALLRALVVAAVVLGSVVLTSGTASAHNVLLGTTPADGRTVAHAPARVVLTFDQPAVAMGTELVVTGPDGPVQSGPARLVDNTVTQDLEPAAPPGRYLVSWRVTSTDGHPVSGRFSFIATAAGSGTASAAPGGPVAGGHPVPRRGAPNGWAWLVLVVLIVSVIGISQRGARLGRTRPPRGRDLD